jgi:hypothetical protein
MRADGDYEPLSCSTKPIVVVGAVKTDRGEVIPVYGNPRFKRLARLGQGRTVFFRLLRSGTSVLQNNEMIVV